MSFRFHPLLTLSVSHGYYGGACGDLGFVLPEDTQRLLGGGRLLARRVEGVLYVLYEADAGGAPLVSVADRRLRIGLKPLNPAFAHITEGAPVGARVAYYRNGATADQLDAPAQVTLLGPVFTHPLAEAARPVTVVLRDAAGHALSTETVTASQDRPSVSFDLTGTAPGALTLEESYPDDVTHTSACYLDAELQQQGVLGVVELRLDGTFYTSAAAFTLDFQARLETLKYYLVLSHYTPAELNQLDVVDAGFTEDGRAQVRFTKVPAAAFTPAELPAGLLADGDAQVLLFKSQTPIPRQQRARRKLQLMRHREVLIEHLPQPGPDRPHADLVIHLSKP